MALNLQSIAAAYQDATACSDADAIEAAFVAAGLLADMVGDKQAGDYFFQRAREQADHISGATTINHQLIDTSYYKQENFGHY